MSSYEKDLEEITDLEPITPTEELKIATSIYLENRLLEIGRKELVSKIMKQMKIAENTAHSYLSGMLSGSLYESAQKTYFKIIEKALDNAPEFLTELIKKTKKQKYENNKEKRTPIPEEINTEGENFEIETPLKDGRTSIFRFNNKTCTFTSRDKHGQYGPIDYLP